MDKHIKNLIDGLQKMTIQDEGRINKELRRPIKIDSNYTELLSRLSKAELDQIRQKLELHGVSQLRKADLINVLLGAIPKGLDYLLQDISEQELNLLKKIIKKQGMIVFKEDMDNSVKGLCCLGVIFSGVHGNENIALIPKEIINEIDIHINHTSFNRERKQIKQIITLINGILYYYGVIHENELFKKVQKLMPIAYPMFYRATRSGKYENVLFTLKKNHFARIEVENPEEIFQEQLKRKNLPYYPLTLKEAMDAGSCINEPFKSYDHKLFNYLFNRYEIERGELEGLINFSKFLLRNTLDTKEVFIFYGKQFRSDNIEDTRYMTGLVMDMYNHTKQWVLKGYSPSELSGDQTIIQNTESNHHPVIETKVIKMSRNRACPCGSGLKYKRCCGKEEI